MAEKKVDIHISNVPERLRDEAKIKAVREGRPLTDVLRELLKKWVEKEVESEKK